MDCDIVDVSDGVVKAVDGLGNTLATINVNNGSMYQGGSGGLNGSSGGGGGHSLTVGNGLDGYDDEGHGNVSADVPVIGSSDDTWNNYWSSHSSSSSSGKNYGKDYNSLSDSEKSDVANKITGGNWTSTTKQKSTTTTTTTTTNKKKKSSSHQVIVSKHAKGTSKIKNPHFSIVDDAGTELVFRNDGNQGRGTYLEYGDQVFPHAESEAILDSYKLLSNPDNFIPITISDLVSQLGGDPNKISSLISSDVTNGNIYTDIIRRKPSIQPSPISNEFYLSGDIVLPNVTNYNEFKAGLMKELSSMPQRANQSMKSILR